MTLGTVPALIVLFVACAVFLRWGTASSPRRGHGCGSQGEGTGGAPNASGAYRPEGGAS
jgi:hypothetical protein